MKKSLLLMLFLALTWSWTAQADELTVCNGTSTNSYVPVYGYYADYGTRSQFIIHADSLSGLTGGSITKLTVYSSSSSQSFDQQFTMYLKEVEYATFESAVLEDWSGMTDVYTGTIGVISSKMEIDLSSAFEYSGGNLMIGFQVTTWGTSCPSISWYGISQASGVYTAAYNNAGYSHDWSSTISRAAFLPKVTFEYTPGSGAVCDKPSSLEVSGITADGATLTWADGSGVYNVEYKKTSDSDWTSLLASTSDFTANLLKLTPATQYQARVQSVCGSDVSGWKSASFVTPCAAYDIPYEYGFEDATPFSCWNAVSGVSIESSHARTGSKNLKFQGAKPLVILPAFADPINTLRLEIWARPESTTSNSGKLEVGYVTDPSDTATFVAVATFVNTDWASSSYEKKAIDFDNAPAGATMAMRQHDHSSSWYWFVDDITVKEKPSCFAPTALDADNITTNSAVLSWTANSGESEWKLYYKKASADDFSDAISVASKPYTLEGLDAATAYQFYVQAVCGASDESEASDIAKFVTACDAISAPWSENFDSYSGASSTSAPDGYPDDELPICWQFLNRSANTSTYPQAFISSSSAYAVSGNCLFFKSSSTTPLYAILPEFVEDIAGLQLTFTYRNEGTSESNGTLHIGYMTDPNDVSTFISVLECPRISSLTEKVVLFDNAPSGSYIAFKYQGGTASNYYLSIDNVSVDVKPSCLKPSALMLETPSSRTAHAASLKWTKGEESQSAWEIAYSKLANFNPNEQITDSIASADSNPFTLSGLEQSTTYYAYVRANCGIEDGKSAWSSNKASFSTLSGHQALSNLALVDGSLESQSAEVNWKPNAYNELHASYEIYYSKLSTLPATEEALSIDSLIQNISDTFYVFSDLDPETQYYVWVRDNCATDGLSAWSSRASFTTLANCAVPFNLAASEVSAHEATIAWEGNNDSYSVQYRTAAYAEGIEEAFGTSIPSGWSMYTGLLDDDGTATLSEATYGWSFGANNGVFDNHARVNIYGNYQRWLVMPIMAIEDGFIISFDLALTAYSGTLVSPQTSGTDDKFIVLISTDNKAKWTTLRQWDNADSKDVYNNIACSATGQHISIDLSAYSGQNAYIAFYGESTISNADNNLHIDNVLVGINHDAGQWQSVSSSEKNKQISGLAPETKYDVQVLGICGAITTDPSEIISFTTPPSCLPVSGLTLASVGTNSASFSWTAGASETQWQYACVAKDADPVWSNENIVNNIASASVSGLNANSSYDFYIRAYCGPDDQSDSIKLNFRTECEVAVLPFVESFDSLKVANSIPDCWDNSEGTTTSDGYKWSFNTSTSGNGAAKGTGVDGGNCVRFDSFTNYEDNTNLLATPIINLSAAAVLTFWWKNPSGGAGEVLISVDGADKVSLLSDGLTSISSWTFKNIDLSTYTGHNVQIFFKGTSNWEYDDAYLYLDNVCVAPIETIAIDESLYATYYNEEKGYIMPENLTGHVFSTENTPEMLVQEYEAGDIVPAATPLVLEATAAGNYSLVPTIGGVDPVAASQLIGVNEYTPAIENEAGFYYYVLSLAYGKEPKDADANVGFYWMNTTGEGGFTMPAHKAYLKLAKSAGAPAAFYLFNGENNATWLNSLEGVEGTVKFMHEGNIYILRDSIIYDATGRKVRELK